MSKKQLSFTVKNLKPRNPMGTVKMTGGGKHIKSKKSVRQQGQKMIRNGVCGKDSFGESRYSKSQSFLDNIKAPTRSLYSFIEYTN